MQIGTTGAAYGPGFSMPRPTVGADQPLAMGNRTGGGFVRRNRIMPLLPRSFDISVHQNELANRVAALQIARHPVLAGSPAAPSPLMAAHAALAGPTPVQSPLPPPLTALPPMDAPVTPSVAQTRDLLSRVALARRGMRA
jgi:hypothetical protein